MISAEQIIQTLPQKTSYSVKTGGGTWSIETNTLKNVGAAGDPNKLIITALGNVNTAVDMLVKMNVTSFAGGDLSRMGLSCCMDARSFKGQRILWFVT